MEIFTITGIKLMLIQKSPNNTYNGIFSIAFVSSAARLKLYLLLVLHNNREIEPLIQITN